MTVSPANPHYLKYKLCFRSDSSSSCCSDYNGCNHCISQDTIDSGHKTRCKKTQKDLETELDSLGDRDLDQIPGIDLVSEDTTDTQADNEERGSSLGVSLVSRMRSSFRRRSPATMGQVDKSEILLQERSNTRMTMV